MRAIFDFAVTRGWRPRESFNPATWNGHLENSLPSPARVHLTENHPSLPWQRLGEFMQQLREIGSWPIHGNDLHAISAAVLEFQILTIARPAEARLAKWSNIQLDYRLWTIPAKGMKERRQHRVPLSDAALVVLKRAETAGE
jgi:integrase